MNSRDEYYNVIIGDDNIVGKYMPLQFALILVKAIYSEFYAEPDLKVSIQREVYDTIAVNEDSDDD